MAEMREAFGSKLHSTAALLGASLAGSTALGLVVSLLWHLAKDARQTPRHRSRKRIGNEIFSAYESLIGSTPMVKLEHLSKRLKRNVFVKMESLNPGGTGKDRAALAMIQKAEEEDLLPLPPRRRQGLEDPTGLFANPLSNFEETTPIKVSQQSSSSTAAALIELIQKAMDSSSSGGLIVEGTSGSTGISLATLAAARGHACLVVLPDDQAMEKRQILTTLGAVVHVVPTAAISNPQHYVNVARRIADIARNQLGIPAVMMDQFENTANYQTHFDSTGPEIYGNCPKLDAFCMSSGTGGTIAGVGTYLKRKRPSCEIVLVDPPGSALYHRIRSGVIYAPQQREQHLKRHRYDTIAEGIGLDRMTANFALGVDAIDLAVQVSDQEAVDMAHYLLRTEGLWVGSSSSMNIVGAVQTAWRLPEGSTVVTVVCDAGHRHVTRFWNPAFLKEQGLTVPPKDYVPDCLRRTVSDN